VALTILDRPEEALMIARQQAAEGTVGPLINHLDQTGQPQKLVAFLESRWPDLGAFENEYPDDGSGYRLMLQIGRAYSLLGNETRFNDAMARVRTAHDRSIEQGIKDPFFLAEDAYYFLLAGDQGRALDLLAQAVDGGMVIGIPLTYVWPATKMLAGDPEFEAIQARMFEHLNAERKELGLEPLPG
jgi:hypothetical protein